MTTGTEKNEPTELVLEDISESEDNVLTEAVIHPNENVKTRTEKNELTELTLEDISESEDNELTDIVIHSNKKVTRGPPEPKLLTGHENEPSRSVEHSEVPLNGTTSEYTYELYAPLHVRSSSEWAFEDSAMNKSVDLSEVLPVPLLGIPTDDPCPYEVSSLSGRERSSNEWLQEMSTINKSVDLSEVLPVPHLGIVTDEPSPYEWSSLGRKRSSCELEGSALNKSVDLSEVLPVPHIGILTDDECPYEMSSVGHRSSYEWALEGSALNKSVDLSEVLPVPHIGVVTDDPSPYELCSVPDSERVISCEYLSVYEEESSESINRKALPPSETTIKTILSSDSTIETEEENTNKCTDPKKTVDLIMTSLVFRIFGILLLLIDIVLTAMDMLVPHDTNYIPLEYRLISLAIGLFFLIDVLFHIYVEGKKQYFSDALNILDTVIVGITLCIDVIYIFVDSRIFKDNSRASIFRDLRLITLLRLFHLINQRRHLEQSTRRLVSRDRKRYNKEGFDLDLTYITERIIAMSFPSSGPQTFFRNPIEEVARFLDTKHPDHYFVYNLCSEESYDSKYFHDRTRRVMIDDHNVPTLEEMILFSKDVVDWLTKDAQNIAVIHCKEGKGRTGTMICSCLIATRMFLTAQESFHYFGEQRIDMNYSNKFQRIATPSQHRYVGYFETVKNIFNGNLPPKRMLKIERIVVYSIQGIGHGDGTDLKAEIIMRRMTMFTCTAQTCTLLHDTKRNTAIFLLSDCPELYADVKVKFFSPFLPKYYESCAFFFWFHTSLVKKNRLYLPRNELDNLHKQKTWDFYPDDFAVELYFNEVSS
ncbi:phosphatidylinositol 3,4,5-trisphosphate 3-phosphatase TPTE2-like [Thomomys bottae]